MRYRCVVFTAMHVDQVTTATTFPAQASYPEALVVRDPEIPRARPARAWSNNREISLNSPAAAEVKSNF